MKKKKHLGCIMIVLLISSVSFALEPKTYEETFKFDKNGKVRIENYKGSIEVETWNKNEIYMYAKVEPDDEELNSGRTTPEQQLECCNVKYNYSLKSLNIVSNYNKDTSDSNLLAFVHYIIKMPATANLEIEDYKSEIEIINLNSDLRLETYKGEAKIFNHKGSMDVETYKGEVQATILNLSGNSKFESYKGEIGLILPPNAGFDVDFDLGEKGVYSSNFDIKASKDNSDDEVKGSVNGGGSCIHFSTAKGEIKLSKRN